MHQWSESECASECASEYESECASEYESECDSESEKDLHAFEVWSTKRNMQSFYYETPGDTDTDSDSYDFDTESDGDDLMDPFLYHPMYRRFDAPQ